jgi:small acid-soluble spore protein F (minor alpha/beta-type SASP)
MRNNILGGDIMCRKKGIMSDGTKQKLAGELGFKDQLEIGGWQNVTSGQAGSMVRRAVQQVESELVNGEMLKDRY